MRLLAPVLLASAVLVPSAQAAPAPLCAPDAIEAALTGAGHPTHAGVHLVRCGDVTGDGAADALFTVASGGTAGDTHFGVIGARADGASEVVLFEEAYRVGVARRSSRSFDVLQPHYRAKDANCCPSSFRPTRYTWTGSEFRTKALKPLRKAPRRFYRA